MKAIDYIGFGAAFAYGLWHLAFPGTVIALQRWFHRGRVEMPKPTGVRIVGALWIILMLFVLRDFLGKQG